MKKKFLQQFDEVKKSFTNKKYERNDDWRKSQIHFTLG